jgi:hypothetical protein
MRDGIRVVFLRVPITMKEKLAREDKMNKDLKASADAWYKLRMEKLDHKGGLWYIGYLTTIQTLRSIAETLDTIARKCGLFKKKAEKLALLRQCFDNYEMEPEMARALLEAMDYEREKIKEMTNWTPPIDKHEKLIRAFLKQVAEKE